MRYFLTSLIFFLIPLSAFAASVLDCEPGSLVCLCPETFNVPQGQLNRVEARTSCDMICSQLAETIDDVNAWQLQCSINNVITPLDYGSLGSTQAISENIDDTENDTSEKDFEQPNLGIEIPGLSFSESKQRIDTKNGEEIKVISSNYIGEYIDAIYGWLIAAGALVAVVLFMVGGLEWMLSGGNASGIKRAKERISRASIGLVLLLSAYTLAFLIDPNTVTFETLEIEVVKKIPYDPSNLREQLFEETKSTAESGEMDAFKTMPKPSKEELEKGVEFYITSYYKPAYEEPVPGFSTFECNVAMQCKCPEEVQPPKTCEFLGSSSDFTWSPCKSFSKTTPYCDKTKSIREGVSEMPPTPYRTAAIDPTYLPFGTVFKIFGAPNSASNDATWEALDAGSAIKGRRIDLFLGEGQSAYKKSTENFGTVTLVVCPDNDPAKCPSSPPGE